MRWAGALKMKANSGSGELEEAETVSRQEARNGGREGRT